MQATRALLKRSVWKGMFQSTSTAPSRAISIQVLPSKKRFLTPSNSLPIVWPKSADDKVPPVRTQARSATILPNFVGLRFEVHNGKEYNRVLITEDMVGHKLGEFAPTRRGIVWDRRKRG
ncbi:unnamed protein product [Clonostachys byssicola]|uniref:Ribosomal protein S19 n=1 Tax=Clonostachys byssicola TaxID=160290 RepID=A0A9N9UWA6_9HYPO|nr:unnamed protein product [Clonostachys byssicola]